MAFVQLKEERRKPHSQRKFNEWGKLFFIHQTEAVLPAAIKTYSVFGNRSFRCISTHSRTQGSTLGRRVGRCVGTTLGHRIQQEKETNTPVSKKSVTRGN